MIEADDGTVAFGGRSRRGRVATLPGLALVARYGLVELERRLVRMTDGVRSSPPR